MRAPDRVTLPAQVWGLAASRPTGPLFATSFNGRDLRSAALTALDITGTVLWQQSFGGRPGPPRATANGTVWVSHRGPTGHALTEVDADGSVIRVVTPEHQEHEHLGAFVVLPDGFCVMWLPADRRRPAPPGGTARVARHTDNGATVWSAPLSLDHLAFPGVVEASADTDWQLRPMKPWTPQTIRAGYSEPLLVSRDRVLAHVEDDGSGIGICAIIDARTGQVIATTEPAPYQHKAVAGPGCFLVGSQGYGAFSTALYDRDGRAIQTWASHGMMLVDRHGAIRGPELENQLPSRSHFRFLNPDGSLGDGPLLNGYYTAYPALDAAGTAVFWRDGRLQAVDSSLQTLDLFVSQDGRGVMSRVLLLADGQVALALHDELLLFRDTGLAELDTGPWPCADGGLQGNPVCPL